MANNKNIFFPPPTQAEIFRHLWKTEQTLKELANNTAELRRKMEENYQAENPEKPMQLYFDAGLLIPKK